MREKVIISWSSGKDSAMALHEIQQNEEYEILGLLTTLTKDYDRISLHNVQKALVEQQADLLGIHLKKVFISADSLGVYIGKALTGRDTSNEEYEIMMAEVMRKYLDKGISAVVFGDIFQERLKQHREGNLAKIGMKGIFPLWKRDTTKLAHEFIDAGFKSIITCVDTKVLDGKLAGRTFDEEFLAELPPEVDPCGENGEFHTFAYDGPIFREELLYTKGEITLRDNRFCFCDIVPG